jgi:hypothetical protein
MSDRGMSRPTELLSRLLGPQGPELTCEACFEHLDGYVELELAGQNADEAIPGMRAHLEGCPPAKRITTASPRWSARSPGPSERERGPSAGGPTSAQPRLSASRVRQRPYGHCCP